MTSEVCQHIDAVTDIRQAQARRCEECVKIGSQMGPPPHLPDVRHHAVL